jgi:glycine amidinotransferase
MSASIVNSWNEWDPLQEVIVGTARGAADIGYEPALSPYYPANVGGRDFRGRPSLEVLTDEAERQLDGLAALLSRRGITVRRPDPVDHAVPVKTPDWDLDVNFVNACPRDLLLVIGDEIIEAPMARRARFFEYRAYRRLLADYFRAGARWTAAPKPLMRDELYNESARLGEPFDFASAPLLTDIEPAFDAASFARFGTDIFWQPDLVSNQFGADWLQRHLGPRFRVHRVEFEEPLPSHIDTTLVPIRPGLVLVNPQRPARGDSLRLFEENGWSIVPAPRSVRSGRSRADVSNWISMNILMLDEHTAVVEEAEKPMIELLRSLGCEVVTCGFDRVYPFGGSFHCCTTDVRRDGSLRSYFPSLDAG